MARRAFFSFHYERDIVRANQVRNSWVTKDDKESAGFIDAAAFEEIKNKGDQKIKNWIDEQLKQTSVTVVIIGAETSNREYVKYEIQKSYEKGNGILGIYVHQKKDLNGNTDTKGSIAFGEIGKDRYGNPVYLSNYKIYDWVDNDGYNNMGKWIEEAAKNAGK